MNEIIHLFFFYFALDRKGMNEILRFILFFKDRKEINEIIHFIVFYFV